MDVFAPIPIIVLHPTLNDAFQLQGTPNITICGGPTKSIQVNSGNTTEASHIQGSANIDLSHAGPKDTLGDCTLGTGADVGVFGQPSTPPSGESHAWRRKVRSARRHRSGTRLLALTRLRFRQLRPAHDAHDGWPSFRGRHLPSRRRIARVYSLESRALSLGNCCNEYHDADEARNLLHSNQRLQLRC